MKGEITWCEQLEAAVNNHPEIRVLAFLLTTLAAFLAGYGCGVMVA